MSNQRVVFLTDDEIGVVFHPPVHRVDAQCSCDDCVSQRNLRSKLMAALEHPEGITDDLTRRIESAIRDPAQFCDRTYIGEGLPTRGEPMDSWRARAVVAALFPGRFFLYGHRRTVA